MFRFPEILKRKLGNGLEVWVVERHSAPLVSVRLVMDAGAVHEQAAQAGLASLTGTLLAEGTSTRSGNAIADELEFLGAQLNAYVTSDAAVISLSALSPTLEVALGIFADVVRNPRFPPDAWENVRQQRLSVIRAAAERPQTLAIQHFAARVFGPEHPYGRFPMGYVSAVSRLTVKDVTAFYNAHYRPNKAVLIAVGDVHAPTFMRSIESLFRDWPAAQTVAPAALPSPLVGSSTKIYLVDRPGSTQSELLLGHLGIARSDTALAALTVANNVMGAYITGRLWLSLRESKGYAYTTWSDLDARRFGGTFRAHAVVQTNATAESVRELVQQIRDVRAARPVTATDLKAAQQRILSREPMITATSAQIAERLQELAVHGLPTDFFDAFNHKLHQVSATDVAGALTALAPEPLTIIVVGDRRRVEEPLRSLGIPLEIITTPPIPQ